MKDGVTMSERNVTYHGSAATNFLASQSAAYCLDQAEAETKVANVTGAYREALMYHLEVRGFKMPESLIERLRIDDEKKETDAKAAARESFKEVFRSKPLKTARRQLKDPCTFCQSPIALSQTYHEAKGKKAHPNCCRP